MHGTDVYSIGEGPKGPALERFPDIKKKKNYFFSEGISQHIHSITWKICPWISTISMLHSVQVAGSVCRDSGVIWKYLITLQKSKEIFLIT